MILVIPRYPVGTHEKLGNCMLSRTVYVVASLCVVVASAHFVGCGRDCGRGTKESNGECVVVATQCGPGTSLGEDNVCTASRTGCGPFTALDPVTRQCVPSDSLCGPGTSYDETNRTCVPTTEVICGPGTVLQGQTCVLAVDPCGPGQVLIGDSCVDGGAIQIVHNAPDPALSVVDIYVNDALIANDAAFRTASAFVPFPAGTEVTVVVAANNAGATPVTPGATTTLTVGSGDRVAIIVGGVVDTSDFAPGTPELALDVITGVLSSAADGTTASQYSFAFYNGAPDIGVATADAGGNVSSGIAYGTLTSYATLPRGVSPLTVSSTVLTTPRRLQISAAGSPIATPNGVSGGSALIALTSGFANPSANNNGPALEVVVALPTGGPLYVLDSAGLVQVVHNALGGGTVDVYTGDTRVAANLDYRTATAFVPTISSATQLRLFTAGSDPASSTPIFTSNVTVAGTTVLVIDGVATADASSPEALTVHTVSNALATARAPGVASVAFYNGHVAGQPFAVTSYGSPIFASTAYGSASAYVDLPPTALPLDISRGGTAFQSVQTSSSGFYAGLEAGTAWLVFASGVATTPSFVGFAIVPASGGAFTFVDQAARGQLVHASPVAEADIIDVYVNGFLAVNDLAYTAATPFVSVPSGAGNRIDIAAGTSASTFGAPLPVGVTPVLTVNNPNFVAGSSQYLVAVGDDVSDLSIARKSTQESGGSPSFVDTTFFNGVATTRVTFENEANDINDESDDGTFGVDIGYGTFSPVLFNLPPVSYALEAADQVGAPFVPAVRGTLDLSAAGGATRLVLAIGFLAPPTVGREPALFVVAPDGTSTALPSL